MAKHPLQILYGLTDREFATAERGAEEHQRGLEGVCKAVAWGRKLVESDAPTKSIKHSEPAPKIIQILDSRHRILGLADNGITYAYTNDAWVEYLPALKL